MIYKILFLAGTFVGAFTFSSNICAMKVVSRSAAATVSGTAAINLADHYKASLRELNLTNLSLNNKKLEDMFFDIKRFIEKKGIQRLILDDNCLKLVPFELLGLGLVDKTLNYISLKLNPFSTEALDEFYRRAQKVGLPVVGQDGLIIDITYDDYFVVIGKI